MTVCHCGHDRDDHHLGRGECLDDDCSCVAYEQDHDADTEQESDDETV